MSIMSNYLKPMLTFARTFSSGKPHASSESSETRGTEGTAPTIKRLALACISTSAAFAVWLACAGFLAGCASIPVPDVATHYDPYTHLRTDLIPDNLLETEGPVRELLWLNASRVFKDQQYFEYYLEVHYEAREETGWLNIVPGVSLTMVADGRELKFRGSGSLNLRKQKKGLVSEDAIYLASADDLKAIASAKAVTVKVSGQNGIVVRNFTPDNAGRFRKFVAAFVEGG